MLHESLRRALDGLLETSLAREWDRLADEDTQRKRGGTSSLDIWNGTRHKLYD